MRPCATERIATRPGANAPTSYIVPALECNAERIAELRSWLSSSTPECDAYLQETYGAAPLSIQPGASSETAFPLTADDGAVHIDEHGLCHNLANHHGALQVHQRVPREVIRSLSVQVDKNLCEIERHDAMMKARWAFRNGATGVLLRISGTGVDGVQVIPLFPGEKRTVAEYGEGILIAAALGGGVYARRNTLERTTIALNGFSLSDIHTSNVVVPLPPIAVIRIHEVHWIWIAQNPQPHWPPSAASTKLLTQYLKQLAEMARCLQDLCAQYTVEGVVTHVVTCLVQHYHRLAQFCRLIICVIGTIQQTPQYSSAGVPEDGDRSIAKIFSQLHKRNFPITHRRPLRPPGQKLLGGSGDSPSHFSEEETDIDSENKTQEDSSDERSINSKDNADPERDTDTDDAPEVPPAWGPSVWRGVKGMLAAAVPIDRQLPVPLKMEFDKICGPPGFASVNAPKLDLAGQLKSFDGTFDDEGSFAFDTHYEFDKPASHGGLEDMMPTEDYMDSSATAWIHDKLLPPITDEAANNDSFLLGHFDDYNTRLLTIMRAPTLDQVKVSNLTRHMKEFKNHRYWIIPMNDVNIDVSLAGSDAKIFIEVDLKPTDVRRSPLIDVKNPSSHEMDVWIGKMIREMKGSTHWYAWMPAFDTLYREKAELGGVANARTDYFFIKIPTRETFRQLIDNFRRRAELADSIESERTSNPNLRGPYTIYLSSKPPENSDDMINERTMGEITKYTNTARGRGVAGRHWWFCIFDTKNGHLYVHDSSTGAATHKVQMALVRNLRWFVDTYFPDIPQVAAGKLLVSVEEVVKQRNQWACGYHTWLSILVFMIRGLGLGSHGGKNGATVADSRAAHAILVDNFPNGSLDLGARFQRALRGHFRDMTRPSGKATGTHPETPAMEKETIRVIEMLTTAYFKHDLFLEYARVALQQAGAILFTFCRKATQPIPCPEGIAFKFETPPECQHDIYVIPVPENTKVILFEDLPNDVEGIQGAIWDDSQQGRMIKHADWHDEPKGTVKFMVGNAGKHGAVLRTNFAALSTSFEENRNLGSSPISVNGYPFNKEKGKYTVQLPEKAWIAIGQNVWGWIKRSDTDMVKVDRHLSATVDKKLKDSKKEVLSPDRNGTGTGILGFLQREGMESNANDYATAIRNHMYRIAGSDPSNDDDLNVIRDLQGNYLGEELDALVNNVASMWREAVLYEPMRRFTPLPPRPSRAVKLKPNAPSAQETQVTTDSSQRILRSSKKRKSHDISKDDGPKLPDSANKGVPAPTHPTATIPKLRSEKSSQRIKLSIEEDKVKIVLGKDGRRVPVLPSEALTTLPKDSGAPGVTPSRFPSETPTEPDTPTQSPTRDKILSAESFPMADASQDMAFSYSQVAEMSSLKKSVQRDPSLAHSLGMSFRADAHEGANIDPLSRNQRRRDASGRKSADTSFEYAQAAENASRKLEFQDDPDSIDTALTMGKSFRQPSLTSTDTDTSILSENLESKGPIDWKASYRALQGKFKRLEDQSDRLREKLRSSQRLVSESVTTTEKERVEKKALEKRIEELTALIADLGKRHSPSKQEYLAKINKLQKEALDQSMRDLDDCTKSREILEEELNKEKEYVGEMTARTLRLQRQIATLKKALESVDPKSVTHIFDDEDTDDDVSRTGHEDCRRELEEARSEVTRMAAELKEVGILKNARGLAEEKAEKAAARTSRLQKQVAVLQARINEMARDRESSSTGDPTLEALKKRIRDLEAELDFLKKAFEKLQQEAKEAERYCAEEKKQKDEKIADSLAEIRRLGLSLTDIEENLNSRIRELEVELEVAMTKKDELEQQLQEADNERTAANNGAGPAEENTEALTGIQELKRELLEAKEKLSQAEDEAIKIEKQAEEYENKYSEAMKISQDLQDRYEDVTMELSQQNEELVEFRAAEQLHEQTLQDLRRRLREKEKELEEELKRAKERQAKAEKTIKKQEMVLKKTVGETAAERKAREESEHRDREAERAAQKEREAREQQAAEAERQQREREVQEQQEKNRKRQQDQAESERLKQEMIQLKKKVIRDAFLASCNQARQRLREAALADCQSDDSRERASAEGRKHCAVCGKQLQKNTFSSHFTGGTTGCNLPGFDFLIDRATAVDGGWAPGGKNNFTTPEGVLTDFPSPELPEAEIEELRQQARDELWDGCLEPFRDEDWDIEEEDTRDGTTTQPSDGGAQAHAGNEPSAQPESSSSATRKRSADFSDDDPSSSQKKAKKTPKKKKK